jgi:biotin carboxyl carrier protein
MESGRMKLTAGGSAVEVRIEGETAVIGDRRVPFRVRRRAGRLESIEISGAVVPVRTVRSGDSVLLWAAGRVWRIRPAARRAARADHTLGQVSPMPGRLLRIVANPGERVERGQPILVLEAMKMEHVIRAAEAGRLARIAFVEGDLVDAGALLAEIEE